MPFFGKDIYSLRDEILEGINIEIPDNLDRIDVDVGVAI